MALTRTNVGTNEDGTPRYHYMSDGPVVITGPITGSVTLKDGTVIDVSDPVVEAESDKQAAAIAHAVALRYEDEGHPQHTDGEPFIYEKG